MFFVCTASIFDKAYKILNGLSVIYTSSSLIFHWFAFFSDIAFYDSLIWVKLACLIIIRFLKTFSLIKTINLRCQGINHEIVDLQICGRCQSIGGGGVGWDNWCTRNIASLFRLVCRSSVACTWRKPSRRPVWTFGRNLSVIYGPIRYIPSLEPWKQQSNRF